MDREFPLTEIFLFIKFLFEKFPLMADYVHNAYRHKYTTVHIYINLRLFNFESKLLRG